jgi:hypothetical protein
MKKIFGRQIGILLAGILSSCNLFSPVDPLPPLIPTIEIADVNRTEITVNGTIDKPDFKNSRQEKKSGEIMEYGLVYGVTENLNVESASVIRLGTSGTLPLTMQSQKIGGLKSNTQYYVAIFARNEGGGISYSKVVSVKTNDQPGIFTSKASVKIALSGTSPFDLDEGKSVAAGDAQADVSMDVFAITGRGTVLSLSPLGGTVFKDMGVVDFNGITYLNLLSFKDYKAEAASILINANTANTVVAFRTKDGRYGKWRIESLAGKELTVSLIAYNK